MTPRKQATAVYLKAAKLVASGHEYFACLAIDNAFWTISGLTIDLDQVQDEFARMFKPCHRIRVESWFGWNAQHANRDRRVLALLLAAQAHEIGVKS